MERRAIRWMLMAMLIVCSTWSYAQNTTGSIVGRVTDTSGASVASASVMITDQDTNDVRQVTSNSDGEFSATLLKPSNYKVAISVKGFRPFVKQGLVLEVAQTVRADVALLVGSESETVTVTAGALSLDTDSAAVGQTINEKQVNQLPLNGRNFLGLIFLTAGAVETGGEQSQFRYNAGNAISIGGARSSSNGYTIDGTSIMDYGYNTPAYNISLDAIQEFKVQSKSYSAEYGYSVNQINISSKSGTNTFHGSVFEYLRNDYLDAKNFFLTTSQPLRQNQFGYSLGGPVSIPGLYSGKDHTFFFANYEGQRIRQTSVVQGIVPTAAELSGQFNFPIYDPLTGIPFPGNKVPASRLSRLGKIIQANPTLFYPAPNNTTGPNNYVSGRSNPINTSQQNYRVDHRFSDADSIFVRAAKSDITINSPGLAQISDSTQIQTARNYTLVETHVFTPTLLNQFRFGYLEAQSERNPFPISPAQLSALGFTNNFMIPSGGFPEIQIATYSSPLASRPTNALTGYAGTGGTNNTPTAGLQSLYDASDSVSWTKGAHTLNFGFGIRRLGLSLRNTTNPLGILGVDGEFSGNQISDLLLGYITSTLYPQTGALADTKVGNAPHLHFQTLAPYVQDSYRVSSKLTVNLGLRYEFSSTPYEEQNQLAWLNTDIKGGGLYLANRNIVDTYGNGYYAYSGRGPGPAPKNVLAPRVGFSFSPFSDGKTVIRGGYGRYFDTAQLNDYQGATAIYPYAAQSTLRANYGVNLLNTDSLYAPPTQGGKVTPANLSFLQVGPKQFKDPYIQAYTFGIQHQLTKNTVLDMDYEGNKGSDLFNRMNPNQPLQCTLANGCNPDTTSPGYIPASSRHPYQNLDIVVCDCWDGYSNYNAANVKLEHRSNDLTLLAAYTWSKGLDIKSATASVAGDAAGWIGPQDSHNPGADYARGSYDVGQRLTLSFVAGLPVGKGKRFGGNMNRVADSLVGGWQVSGTGVFQGGFPFTITANDTGFVNENFSERANLVGNPYPGGFRKSYKQWFSPAAFAQPAPGQYGNSSRNQIRGPGQNVVNLTAAKYFTLTERLRLQFRFESFNALNHPYFGFPSSNVNDVGRFGTITGTAGPNRQNQGVLRIEF